MFKDKINYKLINWVLMFLLLFLIYSTANLWKGIIFILLDIIIPFIVGFSIAYALYPFLDSMKQKGINKYIGLAIIFVIIVGSIVLTISLALPVIFEQLTSLVSFAIKYIQDISTKNNIDLNNIQHNLKEYNTIISDFGKYISTMSINIIIQSVNIISFTVVSLIISVYFLIDMDNIRDRVRKYLKKKKRKTYNYVKTLDYEISQYFMGFWKTMIIQLFEYTIIFYLIHHPYYLILGILASITGVIPYIGGIITNVIACITAFFISKQLFILSIFVILIFPNIDSYIVNPRIFGKSNNIHPLLTIASVFIGGIVWGIKGIVIAIPLTVIIICTYRFYSNEIKEKISDIKINPNE